VPTPYKKPVDLDALRRRRQQALADRVFRWTHVAIGDDEVVSIRRWWSLSDLYLSLTTEIFWSLDQRPTLERFHQEFLAALTGTSGK